MRSLSGENRAYERLQIFANLWIRDDRTYKSPTKCRLFAFQPRNSSSSAGVRPADSNIRHNIDSHPRVIIQTHRRRDLPITVARENTDESSRFREREITNQDKDYAHSPRNIR